MPLQNEESKTGTRVTFADWVFIVWGTSMVWLGFVALVIVYGFVWWLLNADDPSRYEALIMPSMFAAYSLPAELGAVIASIIPGTGLSAFRRISGILLALVCVAAVLLISYF